MPGTDTTVDVRAVAAALAETAREAGALALEKSRRAFRSWTKHADSPVSEIDIAVDELLHARLGALLPEAGWLSEESADDRSRLQRRLAWIVDPIDGTRAFIAGKTDWAISVALTEAGRPIAAVLFAPAEAHLFLAARAAGATLNGMPLTISGERLEGARTAGPKARLDALAPLGIAPLPKVHSLALRLARVAQGTIDISIAGPNSHDWDIAAADLVVHEAGGKLTDAEGRAPTYNRPNPVHGALVAASTGRHAALFRHVRDRSVDLF